MHYTDDNNDGEERSTKENKTQKLCDVMEKLALKTIQSKMI